MVNTKQVYLDYAATTPINPRVLAVMQESYQTVIGNPSSLHSMGRQAQKELEAARSNISQLLGADNKDEIIFTASGSEGDNLALQGIAFAYQNRGKHIITSNIEHHAVLHTCQYLEKSGFEIEYLAADQMGIIQPDLLERSIRSDTILISIMHSNNEIGSIQPVVEFAEIAHKHDVFFHTDAVQSIGQLPVNVSDMNVDLLTLSAHKIYGPKGVGVLFVRDGLDLSPLVYGGNQEKGRRAGTENVPGIIGTAKALDLAVNNMSSEAERLRELRDDLWMKLSSEISDLKLNGHPEKRLPNNLNVSFKNIEAEELLLQMNRKGVQASMGSACNSESIEPSHVIQALGIHPEWAAGTLRLTLGVGTTKTSIEFASDVIIKIVNEIYNQN